MPDRLKVLKTVLWFLVGVLAAVTVVRFVHGLGAVTNLSDATPWGLWIGFDVMSGVALAAGGFVLAATVYIFGLERYRPFVRPAILTALLGYAAVAVGLLYDLGLPWRIWHPAVHWQYHSVLFEVAACVMLYLTVLSLEFAPAILEHPKLSHPFFQTLLGGLKKAGIPLVIAGIVLSTLHQSSLGSLFLITPYRLHALWYSHYVYVLFFVSAVGLGLMMVVLESLLARWFLGHEVHTRELGGLGLAASAVLWLYVALRVGDLAHQGLLGAVLDGSGESTLFLAEMGISAIIPAALLLSRRVRNSLGGMAVAAGMVVLGMVLYRLDVSIVAFARPEGMGYFPSWEEIAVSVGIVSAFALVFIWVVERFRVYEDVGPHAVPLAARPREPRFEPATVRRLLPEPLAAPRVHTAAALLGAAVALPFLPLGGPEPAPVAAAPATHVSGIVQEGSATQVRRLLLAGTRDMNSLADGSPESVSEILLRIDGNRDGTLVLFDHEEHEARAGGDDACGTCHHMSLPLDRNTGCSACHRDMYDSTLVFDHGSHVDALEGNAGCVECHRDPSVPKTLATSTACSECHANEVAGSAIIPEPEDRWRPAAGYMDAMHGLCVSCHEEEVEEAPGQHPANLAECRTCHDPHLEEELRWLRPSREATPPPRVTEASWSSAPQRKEGPP